MLLLATGPGFLNAERFQLLDGLAGFSDFDGAGEGLEARGCFRRGEAIAANDLGYLETQNETERTGRGTREVGKSKEFFWAERNEGWKPAGDAWVI
jgi:hypothetical protein